MKTILHIDFETFSDVDIKEVGAFRYMESPAFEILLLAYAYDHGPVKLIDLTQCDEARYPDAFDLGAATELEAVMADIRAPEVVKVAHNAAFERAALHKYLGEYMPPEEWVDTMALSAYAALPLSLDGVGAALGLQDQKMKEGKALIRYFSCPCKPTIANGGRTRNMPWHNPEKWSKFKDYCTRDVEVEQNIFYRLNCFSAMKDENRLWCLDARINERGVMIDQELAQACIDIDDQVTERLKAEMKRLTALENPNSVSQLKDWLTARGLECESLNKESIKDLLKQATSPVTRRVLELRQQLGKTSTTKYQTMLDAVCRDGRVHGIMQYYGAATGRWAGRLVQPQNLPQNHLVDIEYPRAAARRGDLDTLEWVYEDIPDTLSQLIRTALVAKPGHTFLVCDYSAIEARITAWLSQTQWRMDVFAEGGDIYCASASQMFKVPVVKHGVNGHLRQKGKIAELALGYGGGVNALKAFGAEKMGLTEQEMSEIVTSWRAVSPNIPKFWRITETAVKMALRTPGQSYKTMGGIVYRRENDGLVCVLPSGRKLHYWGAFLDEKDGKIKFWGMSQTAKKWCIKDTFGGRLVENIVQAVARDALAVALLRLDEAGYKPVFHVHDEIICEAPVGSDWHDMAAIMGQPISWAPGLNLPAEGYETPFYKKD